MSSTWGENIRISLFGESHGAAIGVVIDGLPPGFAIDLEAVAALKPDVVLAWESGNNRAQVERLRSLGITFKKTPNDIRAR